MILSNSAVIYWLSSNSQTYGRLISEETCYTFVIYIVFSKSTQICSGGGVIALFAPMDPPLVGM